MRKFVIVLGFIISCLSFTATADDWAAPNPVSFNSRGFGYVAEIFPPRSRQNSTEKPLCYFYEVGYPGEMWRIDAKLKWKAPLVNDLMPYQAVVSKDGLLVTLNEYGALGYKNAVVIYSQTGALTKAFQLDEFIPASDREKIEMSMSSRWWNKDAKYYFLDNPRRLYIVLPWGTVAEFHLQTGRHKYGPAGEFGELTKVLAKGNTANEQTEVWATSLRFSSITDLFASRLTSRGGVASAATNNLPQKVNWLKDLGANETFVAAKLTPGERKEIIDQVEKTSFDVPDSWESELRVRGVSLGKADGLVIRGTQLLCGGTGNCETWVFHRSEGKWVNLFAQEAPVVSGFGFEQEATDGINNFLVSANSSAAKERWVLFKFDGKFYRQSGCFEVSLNGAGRENIQEEPCK